MVDAFEVSWAGGVSLIREGIRLIKGGIPYNWNRLISSLIGLSRMN